jgi:hypothetical protein
MATRTVIWEISVNTCDLSSIRLPSRPVEDVLDKCKHVPVNSLYISIATADIKITGSEGDHLFLKGPTKQGTFALLHLMEETLCTSSTPRKTVREGKVVPELN